MEYMMLALCLDILMAAHWICREVRGLTDELREAREEAE